MLPRTLPRGLAAGNGRLLEAHEIIIEKVRKAIAKTAETRDDGTNDMLFISEHLVDVPVVRI
jgi:hypothetical protein